MACSTCRNNIKYISNICVHSHRDCIKKISLFIHSIHEYLLKIFIVEFWSSLVNRKILTLTEFTSSKRELLRGKIGLFPSFSKEMGIYIIDLTVNARWVQTCKERFKQVCLRALRHNPFHSFWHPSLYKSAVSVPQCLQGWTKVSTHWKSMRTVRRVPFLN